jgi:hypothetical protein
MDLGHLQWMEENYGRTSGKRGPKGEKPMCLNFIMVPRDMCIANSSVLRVSDGVSDAVSNGVSDGVSDGVLEYSRTTNFSQSIYNFRKQPTKDLTGHVGNKTHVLDFYDLASSSHKLSLKFVVWNNVG